jgi:shikimate kinase
MRVYIVGYMGSGKSSIGKQLANGLDYDFFDSDDLTMARAGKSISRIFSDHGEEYFRRLESEIIRETMQFDNAVISTGGGLPCYHNNMEWMKANGVTVYLEAAPGLLFHRLVRNKGGRPLIENLSDVELMEQINNHLVTRTPEYREAEIIVPALSTDLKKLLEAVKEAMKKR